MINISVAPTVTRHCDFRVVYRVFLGDFLSLSTTTVAPDLYELLYKFLSRQQHWSCPTHTLQAALQSLEIVCSRIKYYPHFFVRYHCLTNLNSAQRDSSSKFTSPCPINALYNVRYAFKDDKYR